MRIVIPTMLILFVLSLYFLCNIAVANPVGLSTFSQPVTPRGRQDELLEAAIKICKNKDLFLQNNFWDREGIPTDCNAYQHGTCAALMILCTVNTITVARK